MKDKDGIKSVLDDVDYFVNVEVVVKYELAAEDLEVNDLRIEIWDKNESDSRRSFDMSKVKYGRKKKDLLLKSKNESLEFIEDKTGTGNFILFIPEDFTRTY